MEKRHGQGLHPNSLSNLTYRKGRQCDFQAKKKQRSVTLTDEGWEKLQSLAQETGCASVSDFLEKVSRGTVKISAA